MGNRVITIRAQLHIKNNNQIASTSRFYGRLDTFGTLALTTPSTNLDPLFRQGLGHLGARASVVLIAPSDLRTKYETRLEFKATNNIAEYEGLIVGLNKAKALRAKTLLAKNRLPSHSRTSQKRLHGTGTRIGQILGHSKGS